jgi:hypothetical protein
MIKNKIVLPTFLILSSIFLSMSLRAMENEAAENSEFVFAIFATKRTRADLLEKAEKLNILAYNVNSESEIDLENKCIKKIWIRVNNNWVKQDQAPLPDVVYDFGVYKNDRKGKEKARLLRKVLRDRGIPFINPEEAMVAANDKVLFSKIMHDNQIPHPRTLKYKKSTLKKMLGKHDLLFLKPTLGSKGQGIIIVQKVAGMKPSHFTVNYKIKFRGQWRAVTSKKLRKKQVYKAIAGARRQLRKTRTPYLIQQGISSYRYGEQTDFYKGQQTDFRINVQRGRNGELITTAFVMRVGGNLSQGGRPADYQWVLKSLEANTGIDPETIKTRVVEVAHKTHIALEKYVGKGIEIGDLGMDAVIDDLGNPYIIEANHKSGYLHTYMRKNLDVDNLYDLPSFFEQSKKIDEDHVDEIINYARYLVAKK